MERGRAAGLASSLEEAGTRAEGAARSVAEVEEGLGRAQAELARNVREFVEGVCRLSVWEGGKAIVCLIEGVTGHFRLNVDS